jgi:hypothetical protein
LSQNRLGSDSDRHLAAVLVAEVAVRTRKISDISRNDSAACKYPFRLNYRLTPEGKAIIVAVGHTSRRPGYWRRRE